MKTAPYNRRQSVDSLADQNSMATRTRIRAKIILKWNGALLFCTGIMFLFVAIFKSSADAIHDLPGDPIFSTCFALATLASGIVIFWGACRIQIAPKKGAEAKDNNSDLGTNKAGSPGGFASGSRSDSRRSGVFLESSEGFFVSLCVVVSSVVGEIIHCVGENSTCSVETNSCAIEIINTAREMVFWLARSQPALSRTRSAPSRRFPVPGRGENCESKG